MACSAPSSEPTYETYALLLTSSGGGVVTSDPAGIDCRSQCLRSSAAFPAGTRVTLRAKADPGRSFAGWSGACSGTQECTVTMTEPKSVSVSFSSILARLRVERAGSGSGVVTSSPEGIQCGELCEALYAWGTVVLLSAVADPRSAFTGWGGACEGTGTCKITLDGDKGAIAHFRKDAYDLVLEKSGTGSGRVWSTPPGIDCGDDCVASFDALSTVTLTAEPEVDSVFAGWSGPCAETGSCELLLEGPTTVKASFAKKTYLLEV